MTEEAVPTKRKNPLNLLLLATQQGKKVFVDVFAGVRGVENIGSMTFISVGQWQLFACCMSMGQDRLGGLVTVRVTERLISEEASNETDEPEQSA